MSRNRNYDLETLVFKMGGVSGAARRIINSWHRPFSINELKVALHRKHPELIPGDGQIEGVIERMIRSNKITYTADRRFRRLNQPTRIPAKVQIRVSKGKRQLHFVL